MEPQNTPDQVMVADELVTDTGIFDHYDLSLIRISKTNRTRFNQEALERLAVNIAAVGVVQPILIRHVTPTDAEPQIYEVVAGERRYRASIIAGMRTIPALLRTLSGLQAAEIQLIENIQREDPHPMEEADGYQQLMLTHGHTADQLAEKVNKSRAYIYGRLKLCALALDVREQFLDDKIAASTALLIARIPVPALQSRALAEIIEPQGWPVKQPMSYRDAVAHVQSNYTMDLTVAKWSLTDAKLLTTAGACSKCPKKTGNQPELFPDIKSADVCTDPDCFKEKRGAYAEQLAVTAQKAGVPIHEGQQASLLLGQSHWRDSPHAVEDASLYLFQRNAPATKNQGRVSDFIKPGDMPAPVSYAKNAKGDLVAVYDKATLQDLLEAAGACETLEQHATRMAAKEQDPVSQAHAEKARRQDEAHQANIAASDAEEKFRLALYKQLRKRGENGFNLTSLRAFTKMLLEEYALPDALQELYSFNLDNSDEVAAYIDQASMVDVQLLLIDAMLGDCFCVGPHSLNDDSYSFDALLAMSDSEGIDAAQIKNDVNLSMYPIEKLQAGQFEHIFQYAPERIDELTAFVMNGDPLHLQPLELAAAKHGFVYGQDGFKKAAPTESTDPAPGLQSLTVIRDEVVEAEPTTPPVADPEPVETVSVAPAIQSAGHEADYVDASDFEDAPPVATTKRGTKTAAAVRTAPAPSNPKSTQPSKPRTAAAKAKTPVRTLAEWPFPKSDMTAPATPNAKEAA